jgi:hypothetical protein
VARGGHVLAQGSARWAWFGADEIDMDWAFCLVGPKLFYPIQLSMLTCLCLYHVQYPYVFVLHRSGYILIFKTERNVSYPCLAQDPC